MFSKVEEKKSGLQRYFRANKIIINNPYYGEPNVLVSEEKVLTDMGEVTLVDGRTFQLPVGDIKGIGFDGKPTTQTYTVEDVALMLNSIYHAARNYVPPVDTPIVSTYDYIPIADSAGAV